AGPRAVFHLPAVFPDEIARRSIEGVHDAAGVGDVHHAIINQRSRLRDSRLQSPGPGELKLPHVTAIDLVERAVAPSVERSAPAQPIPGGRSGQELIGDRREVGDLRPPDGWAKGQGATRKDQEKTGGTA